MTQHPKRLFLAGLLATTLGAVAVAQTPPTPAQAQAAASEAKARPAAGERRGHKDPAKFQQRMAERHAEHMEALKGKLNITPAQEGAWNSYTKAMQPPARDGSQRLDRDAFAKLTTPERIDRVQAMQAERQTAERQRGEATKAFYAQLTPEQQKTFDSETLRSRGHAQHGKRGPQGGPEKHRG